MRILNFSSTKKPWKFFFLALGLNVLLAGAYSYALLAVERENLHISELSDSVDNLTNQKANLLSVRKTFEDTAVLRGKLDGYFVAQDGVAQFLNSIQSMGAENRLTVKVLSVSEAPASVSPELFDEMKTRIEVSGAWPDVYRFTGLVQLMPFKISINGVDLEKGDSAAAPDAGAAAKSAPAPASWTATMDVSVLKFK